MKKEEKKIEAKELNEGNLNDVSGGFSKKLIKDLLKDNSVPKKNWHNVGPGGINRYGKNK